MNDRSMQTIVTVGAFDGVHLGHQEILHRLTSKARELAAESLVITFWPHPSHVLGRPLKLINTLEEKKQLLLARGIDHLEVLPFTHEFAKMDSAAFIKEYLIDRFHMKFLLLGYNHHFGSDRQGDINVIKEIGHKYGFKAEKAGPVEIKGEKISSSKIRHALAEGHLDTANEFLGYDFFLNGTVVRGQELGRTIGFPTANIGIDDENKLLPRDGVYAVRVKIKNNTLKGMLNIGYRPTVNREKHHKTIEVHILDFEDDIYGQPIRVSFIKRIRDEIKFSGIENLKSQLENDKIRVMDYLS